MKTSLTRTVLALCATAAVAVLGACGGATSTVDPFKPTRVIGLGDGYNDVSATVREGSTTDTVVQQIATYFDQSNIVYQAASGKKIADLATQISNLNNLSSGDLVVITVGTHDVIESTNITDAKRDLVAAIQSLINAGVKHILVMPVLELSQTPYGRSVNFSAAATDTFNGEILSALNVFGGQSVNPVIYANASGMTVNFRNATSTATFSPFTDTGYNGTAAGTTPACGSGSVALNAWNGCSTGGSTNANYPYMMFADGIHLTPAGNRWVAQYLYSATSLGHWR